MQDDRRTGLVSPFETQEIPGASRLTAGMKGTKFFDGHRCFLVIGLRQVYHLDHMSA